MRNTSQYTGCSPLGYFDSWGFRADVTWGIVACSGGVTTDNMMEGDEAAFISAFKLHVTGAQSSLIICKFCISATLSFELKLVKQPKVKQSWLGPKKAAHQSADCCI